MNVNLVKIFNSKEVRTVWNSEEEKWYFSVVDVIGVLTESIDSTSYWRKLKQRLKEEGNETVSNCHAFKMMAKDSKLRLTDMVDLEQLFRLIQSIPSKNAKPFKLWLASVGRDRINETYDPELAINRALDTYRKKGYREDWINQRLRTIDARKELTDEWKNGKIKDPKDFATLTNILTETWSDRTVSEYKQHKGLTKENLRDNMTNVELALNMLAEVSTTEISKEKKPIGLEENIVVTKEGGDIAKNARTNLEEKLGRSVISNKSHKDSNLIENK
jgi:hypothetical protein